jgi:choline-sulfatase
MRMRRRAIGEAIDVSRPRNLLFIVSDSHSRALIGAAGHSLVRTPHLDSLVARGVQFENAYCASPICVPSRAAIATGLFPHQSRYWENSLALDGRAMTWMRVLRDAGHDVTGIGKFHFRSEADDNGFSRQIMPMHLVDGVGELIGLLRATGEEPVRRGLWDLYTRRSGVGEETVYQGYDKSITRQSSDWLVDRSKQSGGPPWALCVHYVGAHAPYTVPRELFDLYPPEKIDIPPGFDAANRPDHPANRHLRHILGQENDLSESDLKRLIAGYYATITVLDAEIGKLLNVLKEMGLDDSTQVVYTSDHGFSNGQHFLFGLFNLYEPTAGVPLIMGGPEIARGYRARQVVSHTDIFPTILEGANLNASVGRPRLGRSLWPLLQGKEEDVIRVGFAEYHALGTTSASYMLREGAHKLIYHVGMRPQLFDLEADPHELVDLAEEPAWRPRRDALERRLRDILDPEAVDRLSKADQKARVTELGGKTEILRLREGFVYSPPPKHDWKAI